MNDDKLSPTPEPQIYRCKHCTLLMSGHGGFARCPGGKTQFTPGGYPVIFETTDDIEFEEGMVNDRERE